MPRLLRRPTNPTIAQIAAFTAVVYTNAGRLLTTPYGTTLVLSGGQHDALAERFAGTLPKGTQAHYIDANEVERDGTPILPRDSWKVKRLGEMVRADGRTLALSAADFPFGIGNAVEHAHLLLSAVAAAAEQDALATA